MGERVSQLLDAQLCSDVWAVALEAAGDVAVNCCAAGAVAPATALKINAEELSVRADAVAATLKVTLTVWVLPPAVKEMVPLHMVPAAIPV